MEIIAEVKTRSPFHFTSTDSWEMLFEIAIEVGDMISIHTDSRWGGSMETLKRARGMTDLPILAKGYHRSNREIEMALGLGANKVLTVDFIPCPELIDNCLLEPLSLRGLMQLPEGSKAVWNARDLTDGGWKDATFEHARRNWSGWLCQASGIRRKSDIHTSADAILIGEHLPVMREDLLLLRSSARQSAPEIHD